jgi:hypothetical protein
MTTPAAQAYAQAKQPYPAPVTTPLGKQELTHADRCDTCGAQAWVRSEAYDTMLPLLWCAHHFTAVEHLITGTYYAITDERAFLKAAVKAQYTEDTTNWGKK